MAPKKRKRYIPMGNIDNQINNNDENIIDNEQEDDIFMETEESTIETIQEDNNDIMGDDMNKIIIENNPEELTKEIEPTIVVNETSETIFVNEVTNLENNEIDTNDIIQDNTDTSVIVEFDNVINITYINQSTNASDKIVAYNKELRLVLGRYYLIPITNKTLNSDNFNYIKCFSNCSGKLDIRYIKDGFAYVIPLINNITIVDNERLAYLI